ncbi:filamentation induced by cAMP protein Fic [Caballeronia terrestris]|uniref:Filamentation induced by cAMP protein Fic n=1 Tax=Caballeronia terrestris TaxID=1226301 RepID=A0A158J3W3_9BURK|nr:Fic family protein [Caballeronia terrestris]SAL63548.1 filamentation induced by cAMP protein Fic [Caballeronia terrestris]
MATAMTPLLRNMNSYYSNKIEGQHATPVSIEQALETHYSPDSGDRDKQFAAIAHIRAEEALESEWSDLRAEELFAAEKVTAIHRLFFANLPDEYCITSEQQPIIPGAFREEMVKVGNHLAPEADLIPALLNEWGKRYKRVKGSELKLIATACSHQRLAWVHPFIDGNGRVSRLHSHLTLRALGLTDGLWSPLRGFARTRDEYYARLAAADQRRRNELDGRGNLSQEELVKFVHYFLDCCLDQVNFMLGMMAFDGVRSRLRDLLIYLDANPWRIGSDKSIVKPDKVLLALETVALLRPLSRAEFGQIIGESEATVRRITRSLLDFGVLQSASHKDPLSFALPLKSLRFLFPRLWPEVDLE